MEIFIVYKTDSWHSYSSRDLIGICTSMEMALDLCKSKAKKESTKIDSDQLFNLRNIKQTQGYKGEGEFVIEPSETDILI